MSWWRRKQCRNAEGIKEAEEALERERRAREDVTAKKPDVEKLNHALTRHYTENNFGQLIEDAMRRRSR